uniref:Protein kinase domain-containing protein n=1 Tax=Quercus lobata TaxID=97700 RepID=A0A7N2L2D7_QUELO
MYGMRIYTNGIWFGRHLNNVVRLWVSAGSIAFAVSRIACIILQQLSSNKALGGDFHIRISASELVGSKTKISKKATWVVGVLAVLILLIGIVLAIIWRGHYVGVLEEVGFSLILFKYQDLRRATKKISQKLGEGSFGSVFKGVLPNSTTIAVKKIRSLEQGSLESHLFQNASKILDWKTRYQIAIGIAKGLAYLHDNCRDCIMHFDIKPENILLDAEYNPKVADFARVAIAINKGEDPLTLLDHKLEGNANMEELIRACKVACWCIQDDPRDKPTMGQVIQILEGVMQMNVPQIPLYFQRLSENPMVAIVSQETETSSSSY